MTVSFTWPTSPKTFRYFSLIQLMINLTICYPDKIAFRLRSFVIDIFLERSLAWPFRYWWIQQPINDIRTLILFCPSNSFKSCAILRIFYPKSYVPRCWTIIRHKIAYTIIIRSKVINFIKAIPHNVKASYTIFIRFCSWTIKWNWSTIVPGFLTLNFQKFATNVKYKIIWWRFSNRYTYIIT